MRHLPWLLALILCSLALPASAATAGHGAACTKARAIATTIEAVRGNYRAWSGRCVSLRGIAVGMRLYTDRQATLEPREGFGETTRRSIVLYHRGRTRSWRKPVMVEVTGTIGSCADQNAVVGAMQTEHPDDIIMVAGYCHTSLETYIEPVTVRVMSRAAIPRLLEAEVALDHRELLDAPGNLPSLVPHVAAARAMVAALADNDEVAFRRLARPEVQHEVDALEGKPLADWLRRDIREIHAQFASGGALRRQFAAIYSLGARQERVLVSRGDLQVVKTNGGAPSPVITCWCKTADCSGRWPVAAPDADNDPQRPYICARTNDYLLGPREGIAVQVDVEAEPGGFAEPAWPRPARHTG